MIYHAFVLPLQPLLLRHPTAIKILYSSGLNHHRNQSTYSFITISPPSQTPPIHYPSIPSTPQSFHPSTLPSLPLHQSFIPSTQPSFHSKAFSFYFFYFIPLLHPKPFHTPPSSTIPPFPTTSFSSFLTSPPFFHPRRA